MAMQSKPNQIHASILIVLALFLVLLNAKAQAAEPIFSARIGAWVYSGVYPTVKVQIGQLTYPSNEIIDLVDFGAFDAASPSVGLSASVFAEIAGKPLIPRISWDALVVANGRVNKTFKVSSNTFFIGPTEYYIISAADGSGIGIPAVKTPNVSVSAIDATASETAGDNGQFLISFHAPAKKNIRVKFKLEGSAQKGKDYERIPNSIVIPAGNREGIIEIIPINDIKKEGVEKVVIKLYQDAAKRYKLKGRKSAVIKIVDND